MTDRDHGAEPPKKRDEPPTMLDPRAWSAEVRQGRCAANPSPEEDLFLQGTGLRPEIVRIAEKAADRALEEPEGPPKT